MKPSRTLLVLACIALAVGLGLQLGGEKGRESQTKSEVSGGGQDQTLTAVSGAVNAASAGVPRLGAERGFFEVSSWVMRAPNLAPLAPGESKASRSVNAVAQVKVESLSGLESLKPGQRIWLPVRGSAAVPGVVNLVKRDELGWVRVGGALEDGAKGTFSLGQKGAAWVGTILHAASQSAYVMRTSDAGVVSVEEKPMSSVICQAIPRKKPNIGPGAGAAAVAGQGFVALPPPPGPPMVVPELDSLPAATHVLYIDFDGEVVVDPNWYDGLTINALVPKMGSGTMTSAQITEVWKRVAEDLRPFNISVTTVLSRYMAAGAGKRMRCIVTPTDTAAPGAGGVAWLGSYDEAGSVYAPDVPCWAFTEAYYTPDDIAGTISHEAGHTFGLEHDGDDFDSYYSGHGSGATSWGPIMGTTYDRVISQWSRGEYANADNPEDDLAIIGNAANGFFLRTDEAANTMPAGVLPNTGVFNQSGVITAAADVDLYSFSTGGGAMSLTASPAAVGPNLDIQLELRAADGVTVIQTSNPVGVAKATLTRTLAPGAYVIAVRGSGFGTPVTGYTTYGSVGEYTLSGTYVGVADVAPLVTTEPVSQTVFPGAKVTFTVAVLSSTVPGYQWTKDNLILVGQKKNTLMISSAQVANQGVYRCLVTNTIGTTPSEPVTLTVKYKPVFTLNPVAKSTNAGTAVTLTAAAHGTPTVTFQWQHNLVDIPLATGPSLTLTDPQWVNAGSYRCVATNEFGVTMSKAAALTVVSKPVILVQPPAAFLAPLNGSTSVGLTAAGTGKLTYKWFKGSTAVPGQTKAVLTLTGITPGTAGAYHCEVMNAQGTTVSEDVVVTVQDAPVITRDLANVTVARNAKRTLSITAVGAPPLKYEWRKDGVKVPGSGPSLVVTASAEADYQVLVTNAFDTATSAVAHVFVHEVPKVVTKPLAQTRALGGTATFTVVASGTPVLTYQWKKNNVALPGQTTDTLALTNLTATDAASYSVTISNAVGSVTSTPVKLTLQTKPSIVTEPLAQAVDAFYPATFTVKAAGTATLKYQWVKGTTDIPGATAATYKIASVQAANAGDYRVRVTNAVGVAESVAVPLVVNEVLAPTLTLFSPQLGKAGHYVRVLGTHLNWTTAVGFRNAASAVVKAPFVIVSPTELLVTVPAGAASSAITVTTRGGVVTTPEFFSVTSVNDTNDDIADARLIPGAGGKVSGSNYSFSRQTNEERHAMESGYPLEERFDAVYSAWFEWTPAVSGAYYISTVGSAFDTRLAVYTGSTLGSLTLVGYNDDENYDRDIYTSKVSVLVEAGTTYRIAVDGFSYTFFDPFGSELYDQRGTYVVGVSRVATSVVLASAGPVGLLGPVKPVKSAEPMSLSSGSSWSSSGLVMHLAGKENDFLAGRLLWQQQGPVSPGLVEGEVTLGGAGAHEPALAWLPSTVPVGATALRCRATVSYTAPVGAQDVFGLNACDALGQPLFGLSVAVATGAVSALDATGQAQPLGQTLIPGERYEVEVFVDAATGTWGALLNGTLVCSGLPVPPQAVVADFAAQWLPGGGPHGGLTIHRSETSADIR